MAAGNSENPESTSMTVGRLKSSGLSKTQLWSHTRWGHVNRLHEDLRYGRKSENRKQMAKCYVSTGP